MNSEVSWPRAEVITTDRLVLEPLRVGHAEEMAPLLMDQRLHEFIGGNPATREELRSRYAGQMVGHSADGTQGWLNWIVRLCRTGAATGTVQATLTVPRSADLAWVTAAPHQGRGYATEAAIAVTEWLRRAGVDTFSAYIHPDHRASEGVAARIGLAPTTELLDGEVRWTADDGLSVRSGRHGT